MEAFLWILKWVLGPVTAAIVTLIVSEPLKNWLAPIVVRLGSKRDQGVTGVWKATFYYGKEETPYIEVIRVSHLFGQFVAHVVPHEENHAELKKVQDEKPLRLRGSIKSDLFFTGVWFHPNRVNHHYGAFKLLIFRDNSTIKGQWLGYSQSKNTIEAGRWEWERLPEASA